MGTQGKWTVKLIDGPAKGLEETLDCRSCDILNVAVPNPDYLAKIRRVEAYHPPTGEPIDPDTGRVLHAFTCESYRIDWTDGTATHIGTEKDLGRFERPS